jgi:hypothetical protein
MLTIQLCVHCKQSPAGFWVSRGDGAVVRRPWCLACCQELDRVHCDITPFGGSRARSARRAAVP